MLARSFASILSRRVLPHTLSAPSIVRTLNHPGLASQHRTCTKVGAGEQGPKSFTLTVLLLPADETVVGRRDTTCGDQCPSKGVYCWDCVRGSFLRRTFEGARSLSYQTLFWLMYEFKNNPEVKKDRAAQPVQRAKFLMTRSVSANDKSCRTKDKQHLKNLLRRKAAEGTKEKAILVHGEKGSGKTTLIKEVLADLSWPAVVVNVSPSDGDKAIEEEVWMALLNITPEEWTDIKPSLAEYHALTKNKDSAPIVVLSVAQGTSTSSELFLSFPFLTPYCRRHEGCTQKHGAV